MNLNIANSYYQIVKDQTKQNHMIRILEERINKIVSSAKTDTTSDSALIAWGRLAELNLLLDKFKTGPEAWAKEAQKHD